MYSQGVGRFSQGVALGYDLVGLSARFLRVRGDDLVGLSARFLRVRDDDLGWLSVRCSIAWVPILFVVPMDGDALHVDWWCACGLKAQSACSPGQRPGCRGWWVIVPP